MNFPTIANRQLIDGSLKLQATSSSGLKVSYRVVSGPAAVVGDVVTFSGTGLVNIEATQKGNENYVAAFALYRSFAVLASGDVTQQQTIDFPYLSDTKLGDEPLELNAKASSGLAVSYQVLSGPAVIEGNFVKATGAGTVVVEASQYGNSTFMPATPETRTFSVMKADQIIDFPSLVYQVYTNAPFRITVTATSGLPVYLRVISGPVTITGNLVTITGVGSVVIEANQPGNANYRMAKAVQRSFTVGKGSQFINFSQLPNRTFSEEPFTLAAVSSSGLTVHYRIVSGPAKVAGNLVTLTGTGTVVVEATQPGNTFFTPASALQRTFSVWPESNNSITLTNNVQNDDSLVGQLSSRQRMDLAAQPTEMKCSIHVVPNPIRSTGVIRITLAEAAKADVEIYDNGGRLVKRFAGKTFEARQAVQLNLSTSDLPSGLYHVRVANGKKGILQSFQVSR